MQYFNQDCFSRIIKIWWHNLKVKIPNLTRMISILVKLIQIFRSRFKQIKKIEIWNKIYLKFTLLVWFLNLNVKHIFGRAHPIKDWWLYTIPLTGKERQITSIILDKFAPLNIDHSLKFFFDHGFKKTDRLFQEFNDQPTECIDAQTNTTDDSCWSNILSDAQMNNIWEEQYFNNDEIFMESPQDVTHSGM